MNRTQIAAIAGAIALAGCRHGHASNPEPPVKISTAYEGTPLSYPTGEPTDFTACHGIVLVCTQGGVALAGGGGWVLDPATDGPTSVACAGTGDGWAIRGSDLVRMPSDNKSPWKVVARLPAGTYHLIDTGSEHPFVWGQVSATGHWVVARIEGDRGKTLYEDAEEIAGVADAGSEALLVAVGKRLVRVDAKGARTISELDDVPDGVAVGDDGAIFASLPRGVVRLTKGSVKPVMIGMHGPLRIENDSLYVLIREKNVVLRLLRK